MIKLDPGGIVFTRGFSLKHIWNTVGAKTTVGQFIEKRIVMTIHGNGLHIGITSVTSRPTPAYIYYYYSTHRPLSSMHLVY